ncbi:hypothetical protein NZL82_15510 [Sphingomonas sanguinis]|uniref:hypothetical protein n=1 Tax=Sphingomonas sp. LC-1 TaxID=3110957 RepID=UPI0021BAD256|nr:hypothetical protein [Sphingomonas sp. LC-1]MCT8003283.1 hypothetical protein [Sphingomonas sp. LC-1]
MTRGPTTPDRETLEAVMLMRVGGGWAVGIGCLVAGEIGRERSSYLTDREAQAAALDLADRHDLIVVRA